jgi:universal stress protein A
MKSYKKILVALELVAASDKYILKRVRELLADEPARVHFIHVVEPLGHYGAAYGVAAGVDIESVLEKEALDEMAAVGKKFDVPEKQLLVLSGSAAPTILEQAKEHKVDLVVVGSHGRHGLRLLMGSTANAVLHGADCDVLAVREPS